MFIVFIVFSLRQADDPLTFKTVFSLNPSYLVDKYFCFVTLGESQRWIKEGDKDQEEKKKKKRGFPPLSNGVDSTKTEAGYSFIVNTLKIEREEKKN